MANTLAQRNEIAINSDVSGFVVLEWPFIYSTGTDHLSSVLSKVASVVCFSRNGTSPSGHSRCQVGMNESYIQQTQNK